MPDHIHEDVPSSVSDDELSSGQTGGSHRDTHTVWRLLDHYFFFMGCFVVIVQFLGATLAFSFPSVRNPVVVTDPNSAYWILHSKPTYQSSRTVTPRDERVWYFFISSMPPNTIFPYHFQFLSYFDSVCDMQMSHVLTQGQNKLADVSCQGFLPPWHSWSSPERCVVPWSRHREHDTQPGNGWGRLMGWGGGKNIAVEERRQGISYTYIKL